MPTWEWICIAAAAVLVVVAAIVAISMVSFRIKTKRLKQHNAGKGARATRGRAWVLLHTEKFRTRRQAVRSRCG